MLSLFFASTTAALALTADATTPARSQVRAITWSALGIERSVRVRADVRAPREVALESQPGLWLRSIVGPILSTVRLTEARGRPVPGKVVVEMDGEVAFDLVRWVNDSNQAGTLLSQLLTGPRCSLGGECAQPPKTWPDHPHCPSAASIAAWDGGALELSRMLVTTGCFTDAQVGMQPESFWVDDWDGFYATLAIQREQCTDTKAGCRAEVSFARIKPPAAWRRWLNGAAARQGHLPRLGPQPESESQAEPSTAPDPDGRPALPSLDDEHLRAGAES